MLKSIVFFSILGLHHFLICFHLLFLLTHAPLVPLSLPCLDFSPTSSVLLVKLFLAPKDFVAGRFNQLEPRVDEPVKVIEGLKVLSLFDSLLDDLALLCLSFELFRRLYILFLLVDLAALEDVRHEFAIFGFLFDH